MPFQEKPKTRSVGGAISEELYWEFKKTQAARRERTVKALEIAIRLYLDAVPEKSEEVEVEEQHEQ